MDKTRAGYRQELGEILAIASAGGLAKRTECAIIFLRHLNKNVFIEDAAYRGGGSVAYAAFPRAHYIVAGDFV